MTLRFITEDWRLKLFSLGVALVLFAFVTVEKTTPIDIDVRLEYRLADGVLMVNDPPRVVHTTLSGPWAAFHTYDTDDVDPIILDLTQEGLGPARHSITTQMVRRPAGMRVETVRPTEIEVVLDRQIERQVPVHADLTGALAYGYEVIETVIKPSRVKVTGPVGKMQTLDFISTRPIDLTKRAQNIGFEVDLRAPSPPLRLQDRRVSVVIEVAEEIVQRVFEHVAVAPEPALSSGTLSASHVNLTVKGPRRAVEGIQADTLTALANVHEPSENPGIPISIHPRLPKDTWLVTWTPPIEVRHAGGKAPRRRAPLDAQKP